MVENKNVVLDKAFEFLLDMVYPPRCAVCGKVCDGKGLVCNNCQNAFSLVRKPACMKCGKELAVSEKDICYDCCKKRFHYVRGFPLWNYDDKMRRSIADFKYHNKREYAQYYAEMMARNMGDAIHATGISHFVPVPVHLSRLKRRGYNQAKVLAEALSERLDIPVLEGVLLRNKKTAPQKELSDKERLKNLSQAFETAKEDDIINKKNINSVMLVDDIYTTGSTIEACTIALMEAGVEKVYYTSICIGKGYT